MMLEDVYQKIEDFGRIAGDLKAGKKVQINGCVPSQMEHFLCGLGRDFDQKVVIAADEQKAMEILENCIAFDKAVVYYPARDPMFYKADIRGSYISEQRAETVRRIFNKERLTVITCPESFTDRLSSPEEIRERTMVIRKGGTLDERDLAVKLTDLGYENGSRVLAHGEFSIRGNIVDVFPYAEEAPYRIDLWGDTVDSIRIFDPESQRSIEEVEEFTIFAGADKDSIDGGQVSFLSYFDPKHTLLAFDEPARMYENAEMFDTGTFPCLYFSLLGLGTIEDADRVYQINTKNVPSYNGRFTQLAEDVIRYRDKGWHVTICCASEARAGRLRDDLRDAGAFADVIIGAVRTGFEYPDIKEVLISEVDIFGRKRVKKRKKRFTGDPIKSFTDLNVGDYVVHEQHGIGIYCGIERIKSEGLEKDYMKIQYAGNANLYVLATQFDRIQKYAGADSAAPKLNKLGGKEWAGTKARTKKAVQDIAEQLVRIYAARHVKKGYVYGPDTVWQREFEDSFEYEETEDQLRAIEDVKSDMEQGKVMDRLICGDVGFGKTEVAIRAAFKAVQDGKQVAFLAPTTILVKQHFDNITGRMSAFPVNIRMMSRFVSPKEQKKTLEGLKSGMVDIVVGTHRLLSKDVGFKDLGLLIIDEEQRFGVGHKEKIKELRKDVDVLTLSATPIPRTLHMSLSGIRDMSLLTEPPVDRVPIQTYVMEYSEDAVREAILREASRGGQVYYIYNRIDAIEDIASRIQELVPTLHVRFAHGRMASRELEQIMTEYVSGEIDVLVSTTIVESGLDIPNVNTIIIQDSDRYGLSQLYQLRGRVGRANRTAYAFLMYRPGKILREEAEERLKAIKEFSELGGGVRIAMKDLEIRGAGNVLGAEQSGHMEAVGYELYCKLLNEAVALLKGEETEEDFETAIDLKIDAFIPSEYIKNSFEKLNMYKKISVIANEEDAEDVREELNDRFGEIPRATENLLDVALIKAQAHRKYITEISGGSGSYRISMLPNAKIDTFKMHGFLSRHSGILRFVMEKNPYFIYKPKVPCRTLEQEMKALRDLFDMMEEIMQK
ncbi:MAG: transcription-repair coupling factor [Lachnospiraceae bacterium]|nr:transcription-repair coupling factor [Lachnospiraceae bacterium]